MSPEETKERIRNAIDAFIKDEPEDEAQKAIHDVLAAKMRDRINPQPETIETEVETVEDEPTEVEVETQPEA